MSPKNANIVRWGAAGDDDEDEGGTSGPQLLRTKNEVAPPPPDRLAIKEVEGDIAVMGKVQALVEDSAVIQGVPGVPALDEGTVLCLDSRRPIGAVSEIFGPIYEPLYVVRFARHCHQLPQSETPRQTPFTGTTAAPSQSSTQSELSMFLRSPGFGLAVLRTWQPFKLRLQLDLQFTIQPRDSSP